MRSTWMMLALMAGCSAEQNFGETAPRQTETGGEGRIGIFPTDGVNMGPFEIGFAEVGGFRIDSMGEFPLRVISLSLIDAGENAGLAVFDGLRPADSTHVVPFELRPGEASEFMLTATMSEAGIATGTIEIYTNDSTVNDGGPGYVRIPLAATAVDSSSEDAGEDTGTDDGPNEDTGTDEEPEEDTGTEPSAPESGAEDTGGE